jgi:DHA2 family multidrug resistance protein-like MFS transporter
VPTGLVALAASGSLPVTRRSRHRFDWPSAALNAIAFGFLITGIGAAGHGHGLIVVAELVVGAAALVLLVLRQRTQTWPLLPVDLLRIRLFALSISTSTCSFAGQMLAYVSLPFYLEDVLGRNQVETGLLMTPWPLASAVVAPISGRLADRISAGLLGGIGLVGFAAGLLLLALLPAAPTAADIAWRMAICGLGFGLFQTPNNRAIVGSAPRHRAGGASGMLGTARLVGQSVGTALVALIFSLSPTHGTSTALFAGAGMALVGAAVSSLRIASTAAKPPEGGRQRE